ncbi:MAG TPA: GNAT family N-acetyltransferase [Pseudonocardia sp.]|nr:GNAT family N-acetyltransferase [Pseudonocardia sp.]
MSRRDAPLLIGRLSRLGVLFGPGARLNGAVLITTTSLRQLDPSDLVPAAPPTEPARIERVEEPAPEFARFLYTAVGGDWHWTDRLPWNLAAWTECLRRPGAELWVAWHRGGPAGYVELAASTPAHAAGTHTEIAYFGLLPRYIGRGLGGQLLTDGIRRAWTLHERWPGLAPVSVVWLHTCTLDGPHALRNYTARGFREFRTVTEDEPVAAVSPGPWPGAHDS